MSAPERIQVTFDGHRDPEVTALSAAGFYGVGEYIRADLALCPNWQPIETAPKDNTARLVWVPENFCTYCVTWNKDPEYPWSGEWVVFGGGHRSTVKKPSHWMPLPAPPKT